MEHLPMVDLKSQYHRLKEEIDRAVLECMESSAYIKGPPVEAFERAFADYLGVKRVIGCANGTDALQLALMALGLQPGDEVIVPAFTYVATAEVVALLGLTPVMVDVDLETFNSGVEHIEPYITARTRAIVPVHLFGQCAEMEGILNLAERHGLPVVEDAAQAMGVDYTFSDGRVCKAGTMGTIGCTSFFPTKNLGCCGDGGALMTNDEELAARIEMLANHGQNQKYYHALVGVNSRLDSLQAAILNVKLPHLDSFIEARQRAASVYNQAFGQLEGLTPPLNHSASTHAYHQYTLRVAGGERDRLGEHLKEKGIPSVVYYPVPLHQQQAFRTYGVGGWNLSNAERLCDEVLSLPMHTEMDDPTLERITEGVRSFYEKAVCV